MRKTNLGSFVLVVFNIHITLAAKDVDSSIAKDNREKRELQYDTQRVGNYYSNFNQAGNEITTVLPSLDSDGTSNLANEANGNTLGSHSAGDGSDYFRTVMDPGNKERNFLTAFDRPSLDYMDVRGKKFFSLYPLQLNPKRAPSGFLGLRGKKYYYDGVKRAPLGFTGIRGKKSEYEIDNGIDDGTSEYGLADDVDFYASLPKERKLLDELIEIYLMNHELRNNPSFVNNDVEKRAPSGFLGLRGKKAIETEDGDFTVKRAPSGFLGLRGKREYNEANKRGLFASYLGTRGKLQDLIADQPGYYNRQDELSWIPYDYLTKQAPPKRAPRGFMGVRGKKWAEITDEE